MRISLSLAVIARPINFLDAIFQDQEDLKKIQTIYPVGHKTTINGILLHVQLKKIVHQLLIMPAQEAWVDVLEVDADVASTCALKSCCKEIR